MKLRLIPLGLAACLTLSLAACGGGAPAESVPPSESAPATEAVAAVTETPAPSDATAPESAAPSGSAAPTPESSQEPTPAPDVPGETPSEAPIPDKGTPPPSDTPAQTAQPSEQPSATPVASASPTPTPEPSATPTPEPSTALAEATVAQVYAAVSEAAGVSYDDMTAYVDAFYPGLDTGDLADYVFYQPSMSGHIEEIFIAKVNAGKMDAVKSACQSRQQGMVEDAEMYPDTGTYVASYQLVTEGDWLLFCVGANAADAVTAFQNAVK